MQFAIYVSYGFFEGGDALEGRLIFMRNLIKTASALTFLSMLGACCSPDSCRTARVTFETLKPITDGIVRYQETTGSEPEHLEDAFPHGLPEGIYDTLPVGEIDIAYTPFRFTGPSDSQYYFQSGSGEWIKVSYGPGHRSKFVEGASSAYFLKFGYVGPGFNNCTWSTMQQDWACDGYY